jgi:hypothetical protein
MVYFGDAVILDPNGALSAQHQRIAEIIKDLDDTLELAWIPPDKRSVFDKHPFAVVHKPRDGRPAYIAMTLAESEVNHTVIARLLSRDTHRGFSIDKLEAEQTAAELVRRKEAMDEIEERRDFSEHVIKSRKHTYKHNGLRFE